MLFDEGNLLFARGDCAGRVSNLSGNGYLAHAIRNRKASTIEAKAIEPEGVQRYLESKFGDDLKAVRDAMTALAESLKPEKLRDDAFALYARFRPNIPEGLSGWGAKGELDHAFIRRMALARDSNRIA